MHGPAGPSREMSTALPLSRSPLATALAGMLALAVALGIGRFAFTPLLPMMLHDGVLDLTGAGWLASANYLGYLVGALLCTFWPWLGARWPRGAAPGAATLLRAGLAATTVLTLGMAGPWPTIWPLLRFAAGVASAFVFIFTSGWCLAQLARAHASPLGGVMYAGPGAGIVLSGLLVSAMVPAHWSAAAGWAVFGIVALALTARVWRVFHDPATTGATGAAAVDTPVAGSSAPAAELGLMALAYGLAGFGYIITATFLPVIARQAMPGSAWIDLFWPIFGSGVVFGALLCTRIRMTGDLRLWLCGSYLVQGAGVLASVLAPNLAGFAVGSVLLGVPFTAITFFAMQEARRLRPHAVASAMGLLTVLYGMGQILGPPLAAWLLRHSTSAAQGFNLSLEIAAPRWAWVPCCICCWSGAGRGYKEALNKSPPCAFESQNRMICPPT